ncbi:acyl-CoA dehydrogenase family protein [Amycolatopsis sp. cmx-4-68]|uniref:acyl-CoA dehydrogenase family protein n=1 Tax=Amycolatopsis sp. cmx-4-68 TaxID=2790938 RepID=UPI003978623A
MPITKTVAFLGERRRTGFSTRPSRRWLHSAGSPAAVALLVGDIGARQPVPAPTRTRAVPTRDGWTVTGSKIWTSHAQHSHHLLALVRTGQRGEKASTALTQMIVDLAQPGVTVRPIRTLDGREHFCEVFFDDVFVPADRVLGAPGSGWKQVLGELGFERSGPERFLSTFPLPAATAHEGAADPDFGHLVAQLVVLRSMSARVGKHLGDNEAPGVAAAVVKDLGTAFEQDTLDVAREWLSQHPAPDLAELFAQAQTHSPGFTLRGGASEIMRDIIARSEGLA